MVGAVLGEVGVRNIHTIIARLAQTFICLFFVLIGLSGCDDTRFRVRIPPGQQVDVFRQASVPKLDVLWVVDNSASMSEEQQALAENFGYFYNYLDATGADFHIGVISTDIYNTQHQGQLLGQIPIITRATPTTEQVFATNVNVGLDGKGDEQGFACAALALTEPLISTSNAGFLREEAYLFIIFVSDEDDRSFGETHYFVRRFEQIKGIGNDGMVKVAAIVGDVPEVPDWCREQKNVESGERYAELAESTGGLTLSICDDDFAGNLDQLGFSAAGLKRHFTLSRAPREHSIEVWIKRSCSSEPMSADLCEKFYNDCAGSSGEIYGQICIMRQSLPDGWGYEQSSNGIRFFGEAVPPFGSRWMSVPRLSTAS